MSTADITERINLGETATCEAVIKFFGIECGEPSAGLYRRICVHEHVIDGQLCREHVEHVESGFCRTCYQLGGELSHECPISIALVTA